MPPKKAAKHAAKKAAKKHVPGAAPEHALKDTLRTYEHLGRVQALLPMLDGDATEAVSSLGLLSETALQMGASRDAADLLRAAEHYCFGALAAIEAPDNSVSPALKGRIQLQYRHLRESAELHEGEIAAAVQTAYSEMSSLAARALKAGRYRSGLEMARGAEALTRVESRFTSIAPAAEGRKLRS